MDALLKRHGRTQRWLEKEIGCATGTISKLWAKNDPRPLTARFLGELDAILGDGSSEFLIQRTAWHGMIRGGQEHAGMYGPGVMAAVSRAVVERDRASYELEKVRRELDAIRERIHDYGELRRENGGLKQRLARADKQIERLRAALSEMKMKHRTAKDRALRWEASCFAARGVGTAYRDEIMRLLPRYAELLATQRGEALEDVLPRLAADSLASILQRPVDRDALVPPPTKRLDD